MIARLTKSVNFAPAVVTLAATAGVGGAWLWLTVRRVRATRLLAIRDPRLHEGLAFENQ